MNYEFELLNIIIVEIETFILNFNVVIKNEGIAEFAIDMMFEKNI